MGPLQLANWREINRLFCVLIWMVAVALAVVIIGHVAGASSACASKQPAPDGLRAPAPACGPASLAGGSTPR